MKTDEELRKVQPNIRNCMFEDERKLIYYKFYSKAYCQLECKAFVMYKTCECIPFFMPRNDSLTLCDIAGMDCIATLAGMSYVDYDHLYDSFGVCRCLDDCNSISYDVEFSNVNYDSEYNSR
jgi:acid-sensing ion channel, other